MARSLIGLVLGATLLPGCATISTFQRADSLGSGGYAIGIEPSIWGGAGADGGGTLPDFAVSARVGVSERVDVGARIGSPGIEVLAKYQITEPGKDGVVLSLAPSGGGFVVSAGGASVGGFGLQLPLLVGIPVGDRSQFVLGPKLHYLGLLAAADGSSAGAGVLSLGTSVGYDAALSSSVHLLPEIALAYPIIGRGSVDGTSSTSTNATGLLFQAGLAIDIGRMDRRTSKRNGRLP